MGWCGVLFGLILVVADTNAVYRSPSFAKQHPHGTAIPHGHSALSYSHPHDLEEKPLFDAQKLGQTILGAIAGSAIGVVAGDSSMGASGATPDLQDGVGHLWAGGIGGAMAGYQLDGGKDGAPLNRRMQSRLKTAERGMANGMMAGLVGGAIAQVFSGSSDDGGSSASSGSSSSSSDPNTETGGQASDIPIGGKGAMLIGISANMPIIHNAIAGALGGAAAGYMEPEIRNMGGAVGRGAKALVSKLQRHATDFVKGRRRENVCISAQAKGTQVQKGLIDGPADPIVMTCPEGFLVSSSEIDARTIADPSLLPKAKAYLEGMDCDGQSTCYVPACVSSTECEFPGCNYESEAKAGNVAVTYKCSRDESTLTTSAATKSPDAAASDGIQHVAEVCIDIKRYEELSSEQTPDRVLVEDNPKKARVAHCGRGKVIGEIHPATSDYPGDTDDAKLLQAEAADMFRHCFGQEDCFLDICEALSCPVPGCQVDATTTKLTTQKHFNYVCLLADAVQISPESEPV